MSAGMRAAAADEVALTISQLAAATQSDAEVGDILSGALAGVVWMWIKAGKDPELMREKMHTIADEHFNLLIQLYEKEKVGAQA